MSDSMDLAEAVPVNWVVIFFRFMKESITGM